MSAPPLKPEKLKCVNKVRYPDEFTARAATSWHLEHGYGDVPVLNVYKCPHCAGWHMTRNLQNGRATVTGKDPVNELHDAPRSGKAGDNNRRRNHPHAGGRKANEI